MKKTVTERFWAKVQRNTPDACWIWTGSNHSGGYGTFYPTTTPVGAHHYSYELAYGQIPVGYVIDHLCRTPACVNPEHLEAVTDRINNARKLVDVSIRGQCPNGHPFYTEPTCTVCTEMGQVLEPTHRGRPRLDPTVLFSIRLPITVITIIERRADKAHMGVSPWLARVIHHEAVRSHHKRRPSGRDRSG